MLRLVGIGALGNMLSPAAIHLSQQQSEGHFIRILDRDPGNVHREQRRELWRSKGTKLVSTYEELIQDDIDGVVICAGKNGDDLPILSQIIPLMVRAFNDRSKERPFILHCSTVSIEFVEAAFEACREANIEYANYPLTGGASGAQKATMLILASGSKTLYKRLEKFLTLLGKPNFFDSDISASAKIKFIGHVLVFNGLLGISSAIALQNKSIHLDTMSQPQFFDFLNQGAGGTRQWDVALKQALTDHDWQTGFLLPHAVIDAIYTADLLIKYALPAITVLPILQLACAFNYLIHHLGTKVATQTLLNALQEHSNELEVFISLYQHFNNKQFLQNIINSLPDRLKQKIKLDIKAEDFKGWM